MPVSILKNKKGGDIFGILLAVLTVLLCALTIYFFTLAENRTSASLGTEELDAISGDNLEFYFHDSMKLGIATSLKEMAQYSFINKENPSCLTSNSIIILEAGCIPDEVSIEKTPESRVAMYLSDKLKMMKIDTKVKCLTETKKVSGEDKKFLKCSTDEITLSSTRNSNFFSYVIKRAFILENSISVDEMLHLDEITSIYETARECKTDKCTIDSDFWNTESIEMQGDMLIFHLKSKKDYGFEDSIGKLEWNFAVKKS
jgi:hypothetical protein